jgi:hypothetical protein
MTTISQHRQDKKIYHIEYDGYYTMASHDKQENALRRWFDNYKIDKDGYFANDYEWCIVKEVISTARRGGKRYLCEIGDDDPRNTWHTREYTMDHTAPEPPVLSFAAKIKYIAPPVKSAHDLIRELEWHRNAERLPIPEIDYHSMYLQKVILPDPNAKADLVFKLDGSLALLSPSDMLDAMTWATYEASHIPPMRFIDYPSNFISPIERISELPPTKKLSPPPPKHRRNI